VTVVRDAAGALRKGAVDLLPRAHEQVRGQEKGRGHSQKSQPTGAGCHPGLYSHEHRPVCRSRSCVPACHARVHVSRRERVRCCLISCNWQEEVVKASSEHDREQQAIELTKKLIKDKVAEIARVERSIQELGYDENELPKLEEKKEKLKRYTRTRVCVCVCVCVYLYPHVCLHLCTHTHIYTYTHKQGHGWSREESRDHSRRD